MARNPVRGLVPLFFMTFCALGVGCRTSSSVLQAKAPRSQAWTAADVQPELLAAARRNVEANLAENHGGIRATWDHICTAANENKRSAMRGEFESPEEFALRRATPSSHLEQILYFERPLERDSNLGSNSAPTDLFPPPFTIRYDYDRRLLRVAILTSRPPIISPRVVAGTRASSKTAFGEQALTHSGVVKSEHQFGLRLEAESRSRTDVGQNAFGAASRVTIHEGSEWHVAIDNWADFVTFFRSSGAGQPSATPSRLVFTVSMSPDDARSVVESQPRIILGLRFKGTGWTEHVHSTPTIQVPYGMDIQRHYAVADLASLALVAGTEPRLVEGFVYVGHEEVAVSPSK